MNGQPLLISEGLLRTPDGIGAADESAGEADVARPGAGLGTGLGELLAEFAEWLVPARRLTGDGDGDGEIGGSGVPMLAGRRCRRCDGRPPGCSAMIGPKPPTRGPMTRLSRAPTERDFEVRADANRSTSTIDCALARSAT